MTSSTRDRKATAKGLRARGHASRSSTRFYDTGSPQAGTYFPAEDANRDRLLPRGRRRTSSNHGKKLTLCLPGIVDLHSISRLIRPSPRSA